MDSIVHTGQVDRQELLYSDSVDIWRRSRFAWRFGFILLQDGQQPARQVLLLRKRSLETRVPGSAKDVEWSTRHVYG